MKKQLVENYIRKIVKEELSRLDESVKYVLKTDDRQGEYIKSKYDGKDAPNGWTHFIHSNRSKVEAYAKINNIDGRIEKIKI